MMNHNASSVAADRSTALRVLAACFIVTVFEGYDLQSIGVAAPLLAKAMALGKAQIGYALTGTMLGLMLGASLGGWAGDRIGRAPVLALGCVLFGAGSLATALTWDLGSLIGARIVTGLGIGAALPNVMSLLAEVTRPEKLASQGTLIFVGFPIGAAAAAFLLPFFPDLGWQAIFVIGGIPPLLIAPVIWRAIPRQGARVHAEPGHQGLKALFTAGRATTTLALWSSFSAVLLLLYLYLNWTPTLVVDRGHSAAFGSKAVAVFNIGSIAGALVLGRLVDRFGLRWPALIAVACLGGATAWLSVAQTPEALLATSAINGACVVGIQFVLYSIAPGYYPAALRGLGSGATVAAGRLGSILGPFGFGLLLAGGATSQQAVQAILPFVVLGALCLALLSGRKRVNE